MNINKLKIWIEQNPALMMLLGSFLGLLFPYGEKIPTELMILILATIIFLSCYKITAPISQSFNLSSLGYILLRFVLLPLMLWYLCSLVFPDYALGLLLLALCPAGTASPAFTDLFKGNIGLSLFITVISSLISVAIIPLLIGLTWHSQIKLEILPIFQSLALCILLPGGLYLFMRQNKQIKEFSFSFGKLFAVIGITLMIFIVFTKKRSFFIDHLDQMAIPFLLNFIFYFMAIAVGFLFGKTPQDRLTYSVTSGFNNTGLGISIALLNLDDYAVAVILASEFFWVLLPLAYKKIAQKIKA